MPSDRRVSDGAPTAAPAGVRRSATYFPEVEALRGVAILLVFSYHASQRFALVAAARPGAGVSLPAAFVLAGHAGVNLFFVLSAFLLSLPFLEEVTGGRHVERRQYFLRRALRVLPLYYTAVAVAAIRWYDPAAGPWQDLPYLVFLNAAYGWFTPNPYSSVWWSLATEVHFYLVLPLLVALRSPRGRAVAAGAAVAYALAYLAFLRGGIRMGTVTGSFFLACSLFGRGPFFLCGILAAWLYRRYGTRVRKRLGASVVARRGGADLLLLGVVAALAVLLRWNASVGYIAGELGKLGLWHPGEGVLWVGGLLLLLLAPLRGKVLLSNPVLRFVGIRSYSLYLVHGPVLFELGPRLERAYPTLGVPARARVAAMLLFGASLALSTVTYALIERPFLVRKARLDR